MREAFVGEIAIFPYVFEPEDWLRCDGQIVAIVHHPKLFSLLGARYGGDGRHYFAVPKMPPLPIDAGYFIATEGVYPTKRFRGAAAGGADPG